MNLNENLLKQLETEENKYIAASVYSLIEYLLQQVSTEEQLKPFEDGNYWACINSYKKYNGFEHITGIELKKGIKTLINLGYIQRKTIENKYYFSKTNKCLML